MEPDMKFGVSTFAWRGEPLRAPLLERIRAAGFRRIEIFANRPHLDYRDSAIRREIVHWFRGAEVDPPILHLPFFEQTGLRRVRWISALATEEPDRLLAIDETKRALELADGIGFAHTVVHLGIPRQGFNPVLFEYAYTLVQTISAFADVPVLVENIENDVSTPDRLLEFLEAARLDSAGICYDIGHDHRSRSLRSYERVRAMHLNDNGGDRDDHALPFGGGIAWPEFIDDLALSEFDGPMIIEADSTNLDLTADAACRIRDLLAEARSSMEEFREKYGIRRVHDGDLH